MQKTVLIVEDDEDTRTIYRTALEHCGFRVLTAVHGAEGVHMARRQKPDLIIMDIRMPLMGGAQAMSYLKMDPSTSTIPSWALSAHLEDAEELKPIYRIGFDRLLSKPLTPTALVEEVVAYLGVPRSLS